MQATKIVSSLAALTLMAAMPISTAMARPGGGGGGGGGAPHVGGGGGGGGMSRSFGGGGGGMNRSFNGSGAVSRGVAPRTSNSAAVSGSAVRGWSHREGRGHGRRHFRNGAVLGFATPYAYDYYSADDDSCYWLKRRALDTGSRYWWRRYRDCVDD